MNSSINPCNDFYQFACSGWQHRTIPDDKAGVSLKSPMIETMTGHLRDLLSKFDVAKDSKTSSASVAYSAYLYQQCIALGKESNEVGLVDLKAVVKRIIGGWSIGQAGMEVDYKWDVNFVKMVIAGITGVFEVGSMPDTKNVTANTIIVSISFIYIFILGLSD